MNGKVEGSAILNPLTLSLSKGVRKITQRATHFVLAFIAFTSTGVSLHAAEKIEKLRADTRTHAVARALRRELIG